MVIRILHLSDFHFRSSLIPGAKRAVEVFNEDVVTCSLVKCIRNIVDGGESIHLIAITGDLAYSGKTEEYQVVEEFLNSLLDAVKIDKQYLFLVPGNHDVDRDKVHKFQIRGFYAFSNQDEVLEILNTPDCYDKLMDKFAAYNQFANQRMAYQEYTGGNYYYLTPVTITLGEEQAVLNIIGLNSCLFAGYNGDDKKKLALGLQQVNAVLHQASNLSAHLNLVLLHHPFDCYHAGDEVCSNLLVHEMDVILTGHRHKPDPRTMRNAAGQIVILGAGCCYEKRTIDNTFNIIEIDHKSRNGKVTFYHYIPEHNIWIPDNKICPHEPGGVYSFHLESNDHDPPPIPPNPMRYLKWLTDECAYINIRGIVGKNRSVYQFGINELFIPLDTVYQPELEGYNKNKAVQPEFSGKENLSLDVVLAAGRLAIIGDPGSGKTTYLRRIAWLMATAHLQNDDRIIKIGLEKGSFPIFIRIHELCQHISNSRQMQKKEIPPLDQSPRWLIDFLSERSEDLKWNLDAAFFQEKLETAGTVLMLDGLDEAPDKRVRESISNLVREAASVWPLCKIIVTTRPLTYKGSVVLKGFHEAVIASLEEHVIIAFLRKWAEILNPETCLRETVDKYLDDLFLALRNRPDIRRMAVNPVMLTALAVVHWNERKLPEGRVELYQSIIYWLLASRENRPNRLEASRCKSLLQKFALAMQRRPKGRRVVVGRNWAAKQIAAEFDGPTIENRISKAETFLAEEEVDSGIILSRADNVSFWHLTFLEYLAALELGGKADEEQQKILLTKDILHSPDWREILLLFGGVLCNQGLDKINNFLRAILDYTHLLPGRTLSDEAICVGLIGAILRDLPENSCQFTDTAYNLMLDRVKRIFIKEEAVRIPLPERVAAADALGHAGDPGYFGKNFVTIPACTFLMGAQNTDKNAPHYDEEADMDESPVHEVHLSAYEIARYPVTVGEYAKFVDDRGYSKKEFWKAGGFGIVDKPKNWAVQKLFPNRPVIRLSWHEAKAYAAWAGCDLPTEAQWERAAQGSQKEYKKYPWGNNEPDDNTTNWGKSGLGNQSPVGIFLDNATDEGIFDLGGNMWEWCRDWKDVMPDNKAYPPYLQETSIFYERSAGSTDPVNDEEGEWGKVGTIYLRVLRGSSVSFSKSKKLRCTYRDHNLPDNHDWNFGFRLVRNR